MRASVDPRFLRLWLARLCLLVGLGWCAAAQAATYASASIPFRWIDPSGHTKIGHNTSPYKFNGGNGCGTTPPVIDDTLSDPIPIGFSFHFGSGTYTSLRVQTNGRLQFNDNITCGVGTQSLGPPQTYPYLYPSGSMDTTMKVFGVDLDPTNLVDRPDYPTAGNRTSCADINTCFVSVATVGSSPNRRFVVTWYRVPEWVSASNSSGSFDVQVVLYENGSFVFQYGTISHGGDGTAQIGWQLSSSDYEVLTFGASAEPPPNSAIVFFTPTAVLAWYQFEEGAWSAGGAGQVRDSSGNALHGESVGTAQATSDGQVCRAANIPLNTSAATVSALKLGASFDGNSSTTLAGTGTLMFWFKANTAWNGSGRSAQLLDAGTANGEWFYVVRRSDGSLRFVVTDSTGTVHSVATPAQSFAANSWQHVTIFWNFNGNPGSNQDSLGLSLNGGEAVTISFTSDGSLPESLSAIHLGDNPSGFTGPDGSVNSADGVIDEVQVFSTVLTQGQQVSRRDTSHACGNFAIHHLELRHGSWAGVACSPATLTVVACADAACSTLYTGGVQLTMGSSGISTTWMPGGDNTLAIGYGNGSATKQFYAAAGSGTLQVPSSSITVGSATRCNGSGNSCTWTATASGLLLSVPVLTGGRAASFTVQAVESVGNTPPQACVAIQNLSGAGLRLWAQASSPTSFAATSTSAGVTVGGAPLVGTSSAGTTTRLGTSAPSSDTLSGLSFDSNARTTLWIKHMDVGRFTLAARLVTSMPPLSLDGSSSVDAQPLGLGVALPAAWTAANAVQTACLAGPSSGCDSTAGAAAKVGAAGSGFSSTVTAALWTQDADLDLSDNPVAPSFSGSVALSPQLLAPQGGSAGALASTAVTLSGGSSGAFTQSLTQSGALRIAASGSWLGQAVSGRSLAIGRVVPRYFKTTLTTAGCGSFTYSGQPMAVVTVQAMDGAGMAAATGNYTGAFARAVTLSDSSAAAGSLVGTGLAASGFTSSAGATAAPTFTFTSKLSAPATLALRATDGEVSSAGVAGAEAAPLMRSGRLRLSNAFGQASTSLALPLTAEYWGGSSWVLNSADSCSTPPTAAVALSNPRNALGGTSSASSSVSAISFANGQGQIRLAAPTPAGSSLSLDLALNLGSSSTDQSCQANHPATTGAQLAWLRSNFGSCGSAFDRDPAARASFGIFSPETRKTVHAREIF